VCKALVESGKLYYEKGRWHWPSIRELGIPQSVRVAIQSRVSKLPPDAQETLCLAAVLGREFDFDTLAKAGELDEDVLIEALETAERAQVIEEVPTERGGTFAFEHKLIPTTLVDGLRTLQRRRLHRRVAAAIESQHPDRLEALAYHHGQAGNAEKATDYLLQAGDRARGMYAHQEAIDSYQEALDFLKQTGDMERTARTLMKLGLTYHNAFDFKAARQAYEEGFIVWQRLGEVEPADLPASAPHALRLATPEPLSLDPGLAIDMPSIVPIEQLFSGLLELSPDMSVLPDVASSWEVLEGGRKYIFHLRDDVRWSDGVQVTAGDFEYAWKRMLDPASGSPLPSLLFDIRHAKAHHQGELTDPDRLGVRASDEVTLVVELEEPTSYFPYLLTYCPTFAVPEHVVEARRESWAEPDNIVTNGPFTLVAWKRGESMVLERNPVYHGRSTGNLQRVEALFLMGQPERELQMYEENSLEILLGQSAAEMDRARHRYPGEYVSAPAITTGYVGFDVNHPPFDDRRVRLAFTLATDRETLAHVALRGYTFPATGGLVPPGMPGHSPGIGLPYDPEGAREHLAEAGYPSGSGFPAVEILVMDAPAWIPAGEYLRAQWLENLGVEIIWKPLEWRELLNTLSRETPHLWLMGWRADYPDPDSFLRASEWRVTGGWENEAYDGLVDGARRVANQRERMRMYQQADRILVAEAPILPLFYERIHMLVKPWVRRFPTSPVKMWFWKDVIIEPH